MKKIIVIADYVSDTLACQEIKSTIEGYLKESQNLNINYISSTPNTIHAGYLLSQIVYTEERYRDPQETVIFVNVDPRLQKQEKIKEAVGAVGLIIKLASGIYIIGPNAGNSFSLIKDKIETVYSYEILSKGSQFRSRDLYSRVIAHLADYMEDELEMDQVSSDQITHLKGYYIGHIDSFGNIKTTIIKEDFKGKYQYQDELSISINNKKQTAKYVDNLFGAEVGQLVIYPGSSGRIDNPYLEISSWSHFGNDNSISKTGKDFFPQARPGDIIEIEK